MTLKEAYKYGIEYLKVNTIAEADLDAWYLLEFVTGVDRAAYYADMDRRLAKEQRERYQACLDQRTRKIPLQHITGVQEFMGLVFQVDESVLIPRQDTETLVECAEMQLKKITDNNDKVVKVLDMCTGSGCILISLMKRNNLKSGTGVDISREALTVAARNARYHQVAAEFYQSDLFVQVKGVFDIIVSNPPYIETGEIAGLQTEVRLHDPYQALDGGADGLDYYRRIVQESVGYLTKNGSLILEIGCGQGAAVSRLLAENNFADITVTKDLSGLDRVVSGVYNKQRV